MEETQFQKIQAWFEKLDQKIEGLVLDLRNNPGGLLTVAVEVAEQFVPRDQLIVYTKGRQADQEMRFVSKGVREPRPYPIVVLINHGSASASEIVAGAVKDHKLAILLGVQSFGKGSVQTVVPMRDGSAIRLTTARYYTPAGTMIHGIGIKPDIDVPFQRIDTKTTEEERKKKKVSEIFDKVSELEEPDGDEAKPTPDAEKDKAKSSEDEELDNQVQRAVDLIRALNVYGVKAIEFAGAAEPEKK